uniref:Immunoglobulin C1-set domain-containing protein n=1 Tax=Pygocentrus nattereri TaxID=42514 RepID=A0A3B4DIG1_PYGNA
PFKIQVLSLKHLTYSEEMFHCAFVFSSGEVDVYVFVKKSVTDLKKLTLTCLATGFYPKDMEIKVRKVTTSLPEHLLRSSGVRPNDDGTYQLRKSVEINEGEAADYDCYVTHSSISTPVIKQWGEYIC